MHKRRGIIERERALYLPHIKTFKNRVMAAFTHCEEYEIFRFMKALRLAEYYQERNKLLYVLWLRRSNLRGNSLGYFIPPGVLGNNVKLYHRGNIIININSRIGDGCKLHGDNCIGNNGKTNDCPVIGCNVEVGIGAKIIGGVHIADGVKIGANAVVTKSCNNEGATLVGVPAKVIE